MWSAESDDGILAMHLEIFWRRLEKSSTRTLGRSFKRKHPVKVYPEEAPKTK